MDDNWLRDRCVTRNSSSFLRTALFVGAGEVKTMSLGASRRACLYIITALLVEWSDLQALFSSPSANPTVNNTTATNTKNITACAFLSAFRRGLPPTVTTKNRDGSHLLPQLDLDVRVRLSRPTPDAQVHGRQVKSLEHVQPQLVSLW